MKTFPTLAGAILIVASLGSAALAQHTGHGAPDMAAMQKQMEAMMPKASDAPSTKALKEAHTNMMMSAESNFTGKADVDFVRQMIPHHQGAIEMAKAQLAHGKDKTTRAMARKIIKDQEREISEMQVWLKKNDK
jgi:uncharacterized protein (DUF305 family)